MSNVSLRYVELGKGGSDVGYTVKPFDGTLRVTKQQFRNCRSVGASEEEESRESEAFSGR